VKNQKKYINKDSDLIVEKFSGNLVLKYISNSDFLVKKIKDLGINYWESHSELIFSIWNDIVESDITIKYLNNKENGFESDKSYLTNLFRKVIASNKK
jgi:N utilization substance protein B